MDLLFIAGVLTFASVQPQASTEHDRLTYYVAGMTSKPTFLDLDLIDGSFSLEEGSKNPMPIPTQKRGKLDAANLTLIRKMARSSLINGLESRNCERARKKGRVTGEAMDYRPRMAISVNQQRRTTPINPSCWSNAAKVLLEAVLSAVHKADA